MKQLKSLILAGLLVGVAGCSSTVVGTPALSYTTMVMTTPPSPSPTSVPPSAGVTVTPSPSPTATRRVVPGPSASLPAPVPVVPPVSGTAPKPGLGGTSAHKTAPARPVSIKISGVAVTFPPGTVIKSGAGTNLVLVWVPDGPGVLINIFIKPGKWLPESSANYATQVKKWFGTDNYTALPDQVDPVHYVSNYTAKTITLSDVFDTSETTDSFMAKYYANTTRGVRGIFAVIVDPYCGFAEMEVAAPYVSGRTADNNAAKLALDTDFVYVGVNLAAALRSLPN